MAVITSPLRYPGGKSSLTSFFIALLESNGLSNAIYVEPYAGGAGAGLNLLLGGFIERLIINDSDPAIYHFWKALIDEPEIFIKKINDATLTIEEWRKQKNIYLNPSQFVDSEVGFATFYLNRCNRSGIIRANPIGGINQTGKWLIDARFNKENLVNRVKNIVKFKDKISIESKDALDLVRCISESEYKNKCLIYLDPPYYNFGQELYLNAYKHDDHMELANFLKTKKDLNWIMTYDNHDAIKDMYGFCRIVDFNLNYFAYKPRKGSELLISPWSIKLPEEDVQPHYGLDRIKIALTS